MGRSFESVRMGVKDISARWLKASRALKKEDRISLSEDVLNPKPIMMSQINHVSADPEEFGRF